MSNSKTKGVNLKHRKNQERMKSKRDAGLKLKKAK